jgi:hypothetical protein
MQAKPSSSKIFHVTVVEPGYFRTDPLGASALSVSPSRIAGYGATADRVRTVAAGLSHQQRGDSSTSRMSWSPSQTPPSPPRRLPLAATRWRR